MKKKIVFVMPNLSGGGAEKAMSQLAENLNRNKYQIIFIIFDKHNQIYLKKTKIKIIKLDKQKISYGIFKFISSIKKINPEIIISSVSHLNLFISLIKFALPKKTKLILRESNFISNTLRLQDKSFIMRIFYNFFYNNCDKCLAFSKNHKKDILKNTNMDKHKIVIIPNLVNTKIIKKLSKYKIEKKYKKYFKNKTKKFIIVGSLSYQKGIDIILNSLKYCKKNFLVNILGEGSEYLKLKKIIYSNNLAKKVNIIPFKKNPFPFIKISDFLILSSRFEGMSNVVLETLSLDKQIIYFNNPGASTDLLKKISKNLMLRSAKKKYIANVLDNIKVINKNSNEQILKKFQIKVITRKYEKIIDDLL